MIHRHVIAALFILMAGSANAVFTPTEAADELDANEELHVVAECTEGTDTPAEAARCVMRRLTLEEIEKCLELEDECYGENNYLRMLMEGRADPPNDLRIAADRANAQVRDNLPHVRYMQDAHTLAVQQSMRAVEEARRQAGRAAEETRRQAARAAEEARRQASRAAEEAGRQAARAAEEARRQASAAADRARQVAEMHPTIRIACGLFGC